MKINVRFLLMLVSTAAALLMVSICAQQPIVAAAVLPDAQVTRQSIKDLIEFLGTAMPQTRQ
jgi:hypothetical protein